MSKKDNGKIKETANLIKMVFTFSNKIDLEILKEFQAHYDEQISKYEAIGFIEGHVYLNKMDMHKVKFKRLDCLIKLIETLRETNESAIQNPEKNQLNISELLGL